MKHNTDFIQNFMTRCDYPKEAADLFTEVLSILDNVKAYAKIYDAALDKFFYHQSRIESKLLARLTALAKLMGYSPYTMHFVFLLSLTEDLKNQYQLFGISEETYWETMNDLKYKMLECMECKGVPGSVNPSWLDGFFHLDRVAYGRFQYEVGTYNEEKPFTMKNGHVIKNGDILINFHIPSSGVPLTDEVRLESYKKAYKHVRGFFPDGNVIFCCSSWLLFPRHREFLPEKMNILRFMDDFEIVRSWEDRKFHDSWRIFGRYEKLPPKNLPRDTALRKAYAEWLCAGNKTGGGFGLFMFDGEKII